MRVEVHASVTAVTPSQWDTLIGDSPFARHSFLAALEHSGSIGGQTGWLPQYLCAYDDADKLLGALPAYIKHHSYGEYVFDWAWAGAYARAGVPYYPKLVVAIPFTPATGTRIFTHAHASRADVTTALLAALRAHGDALGVSSIHWLFTPEDETAVLERNGYLRRVGCQFHWHNAGFAAFDDFLAGFSAQKRKKIKRERRFVHEAGVEMEAVAGTEATAAHWRAIYEFYRATIRKHGAVPYLQESFFDEIARTQPETAVLILARHGGRYVAGALNLRSRDTLYGRYWGCIDEFHSLHFETCYYRALEYCIEHRIARFEAGAQGEHKLARGFLPAPTYSAHWLSHPEFARAVADFLTREQNGVEYYMSELHEHSPFKKDCP